MAKEKTVNDLIRQVEKDPELKRQLQEDPVKVLREFDFSGPIYTRDKLIYRLVVGGFVGVLVVGIVYFIYQYQNSLDVRREYSEFLVTNLATLTQKQPSMDSLSYNAFIKKLNIPVISAQNLGATTPDGVIAVFTAIIGALAGLLAPSPLSRSNNNGSGES
jgi:hypothetical protein